MAATVLQCGQWAGRPLMSPTMSIWDVPAKNYNGATDTYTETHGCEFRQVFQVMRLHVARRCLFSRFLVIRPYPRFPPSLRLQDLPFLKKFYTNFEINFHAIPYVNFAERYWNYSFVICAMYLVSLPSGLFGVTQIHPRTTMASIMVIEIWLKPAVYN